METSVKFFMGSQAILPPLGGVADALATILRACLVTGAGATNVATITVTAGIATASFATAHGYLPRQVVQLAGAAPAAINGQARIISVPTPNSITFPTTAADGAASGAITCKLAAAGWEEVFTATGKTVLRSRHEDATGMLLRVDDTGTTSARVVGYEAMTDIDTGTGPFPTEAQQPGGLYWPKANNATGTRHWVLVADERTIYFYVQPTTGNSGGSLLGFGDFVGGPSDAWNAFLAGHATALMGGGAGCLSAVGSAPAVTLVTPEQASGVGGATLGYLAAALRTSGVSGNSAGSQYSVFPDPATGGVLLTPPMVVAGGYRGPLPGLLHTPQMAIVRLAHPDTDVMPGYLPVTTFVGVSGVALLQIEGDWRAP